MNQNFKRKKYNKISFKLSLQKTFLKFIYILIIFQTTLTLNETGIKNNQFYQIQGYYGSRDKEFFTVKSISGDGMVVVRWSQKYDWKIE